MSAAPTSPSTPPAPANPILVVEDSSVYREMQTLLLKQAGFTVSGHETPQTALAAAARQKFDLVVIDYELPGMTGEELMHALRKIQPTIAVIFVSGSLTLELAIKLGSQGVAGIFNKPANPKLLLEKINETLARNAVRDTAARTGSSNAPIGRPTSGSPYTTESQRSKDDLAYAPHYILGSSVKFREFTHRLWKVRDFRSVLLLQGEPGSPFEHFARELAEISIFRDGPVMLCDVTEFAPQRLIEVLAPCLLSHDAGTLIITGVEALSAEQQKTLLSLTTGRDMFLPFARRFRVVLAATSRLTERVDEADFDETLFYKVSSLSVTVPSLREMRGDIVTNAVRILAQLAETEATLVPSSFDLDAAEWVEAQEWPGNYDQLAYVLQRSLSFNAASEITLEALQSAMSADTETETDASRRHTPAAIAPREDEPSGEARPPFPLTSDLAKDAAKISAMPIPQIAIPAPIPAGANGSARGLTAKSLFRPASTAYNFSQRLTEVLAGA